MPWTTTERSIVLELDMVYVCHVCRAHRHMSERRNYPGYDTAKQVQRTAATGIEGTFFVEISALYVK